MIFLHDAPEGFRAGKTRATLQPAAKENDNKNPVDEGEHPVMHAEKRDQES